MEKSLDYSLNFTNFIVVCRKTVPSRQHKAVKSSDGRGWERLHMPRKGLIGFPKQRLDFEKNSSQLHMQCRYKPGFWSCKNGSISITLKLQK